MLEQRSAVSRYAFLDIVVDMGCRRVTRGSEVIHLPRLSYDLLIALLEAAPNALSYDDLVDRVWKGRLTSPETV